MNRMSVFINNATNDLHCRLNSLLADFSHCDSVTLSTLFKTYCMNLYGSQMWRYNDKNTRSFYTCCRKAIRRLYNIPYRTHNIFVHHIIYSYPIDVVLEKRSIKYGWNLINSGCELHADILILSMDNLYSTIGENIRYFMFKYKFSTNDWYRPLSFLNNKIDTYVILILYVLLLRSPQRTHLLIARRRNFITQCPCYHIMNDMLECYLWASSHQLFDYLRAHHVSIQYFRRTEAI